MSRNPFQPCDLETEFSWGKGRYPAPYINFSVGSQSLNDPLASNNGSGFSIADPDSRQQMLDLAAAKRTDLGNPREAPTPAFTGGYGEHPMYYADGNTDRYGAGPPLVDQRRYPRYKRWIYSWPSWMQRQR
jgi:hypothetical protein